MKKIHILESTLRYLLDEGRNAEKAKQKTIAVMKNYLSQNGIQGEQLDAMAMEYEHSFKEWLFHANMPDSIIRLEPIMANVAMQLGFTPKDKDTRELYRLKDITNYIIANYQNEDFPIALNKLTLDNTSFDSLNELFGSAMDSSKGSWKPSDNGKSKPHYTVKRLDTFEEAHKYHPYTQNICYLGDEETWNDYTEDGKNAVYMLLRDGWENIPAKHGEDTPYDDYGESMVFVIIRPDSGVAYTNTRWNHDTEGNGPRNVDQSFTDNMNDISDMLQTDYRNVLKPYTDEELLGRGEIKLSVLRGWISEGKDILAICKNSKQITDDLFQIKLSRKSIVLYNFHMNKLMPSDEFTLQNVTKSNEERIAIQRDDGKRSFINPKGELLYGWYLKIRPFTNGYTAVQRDDRKWSFINQDGQQIGDWYEYLGEFSEGFAIVGRGDDKWSFINTKGQQICGWYADVSDFYHGYANVQREDGKWAFINTEGQLISQWYKKVNDFYNDCTNVQREDGRWTLINTEGKQLCGWYKHIFDFSSGLAKVQRDDEKYTFINTKGKQLCDWYKELTNLNNGFFLGQKDDWEWVIINTQRQQIGDSYKHIQLLCGNFLVQRTDSKYTLINPQGKQLLDWYDKISIHSYNPPLLSCKRSDGKWSLINTKGQQISDWYDFISFFVDGFAHVLRSDKKYAFINTMGQQISGWFDDVKTFKNGLACVKLHKRWYRMDTNGNLYDYRTKQPISLQNESYLRLNNLIAETLQKSIRNYLLNNK